MTLLGTSTRGKAITPAWQAGWQSPRHDRRQSIHLSIKAEQKKENILSHPTNIPTRLLRRRRIVQYIGTAAHDTAGPHIIRRAAAEASAALSFSFVGSCVAVAQLPTKKAEPDLTSPVHAMMEGGRTESDPIFRSRPALARARPQIKRFRSCACLQRSAGACSFDRSIKAEKLRRSGSFRHTTPAARLYSGGVRATNGPSG
jgi:hypothetical protein